MAIHKFVRQLQAGRSISIFGSGQAERDYTYVDDVVNGLCRALDHVGIENGSSFEILNIGAGRTVKLSELVALLGEATHSSPGVSYLAAQPGDVPRTWADISRAREVLGWEPAVPIEEGLRRFVSWYLAKQEPRSGPATGDRASSVEPASSANR